MEVTRQITKHNYLVMDVRDLPRVVKEVRVHSLCHTGLCVRAACTYCTGFYTSATCPASSRRCAGALQAALSLLFARVGVDPVEPVQDLRKCVKRGYVSLQNGDCQGSRCLQEQKGSAMLAA